MASRRPIRRFVASCNPERDAGQVPCPSLQGWRCGPAGGLRAAVQLEACMCSLAAVSLNILSVCESTLQAPRHRQDRRVAHPCTGCASILAWQHIGSIFSRCSCKILVGVQTNSYEVSWRNIEVRTSIIIRSVFCCLHQAHRRLSYCRLPTPQLLSQPSQGADPMTTSCPLCAQSALRLA